MLGRKQGSVSLSKLTQKGMSFRLQPTSLDAKNGLVKGMYTK